MSSCVLPYSTYDYDAPRYIHRPYIYHQPTKVIVVKQKTHKHKHKSNKRHIKVKINKHRKTR